MVRFAWSWKDYEREKRKAERKAAKARLSSRTIEAIDHTLAELPPPPPRIVPESADPTPRRNATPIRPAPSPPEALVNQRREPPAGGFKAAFDKIMQAERDKQKALAAQQADLQMCDLCGKRRRSPCTDRGRPIL